MHKKIVIYDFDGTLTPNPVTKFEILEKCGYNGGVNNLELVENFQNRYKKETDNFYEAIYKTFIEMVNKTSYKMIDSNICLGADRMEFNPGVMEFFESVKNDDVFNYILSSGLKSIIQKTKVAKFFDEIYGTTFMYDKDGVAYDIDCLIDDQAKAFYIEKIVKDNKKNNCSDVMYIGDGLTDYYAMEYVKNNGGTTIFVYYDEDSYDLLKARESGVVSYFFKADYSSNGELSEFIRKWCED